MGYKKMDQNFGFADLALESSLKHNRSLKTMEKLDKAINWSRVEEILMNHYTVGTSSEGADAYPPLLLFKCLMLQKWFRIHSDPELENQINDRLSFKRFLGLSFSKPSPDHSTSSRFRSCLSKNAMNQINSEILRQFENQGLTINDIADGIMRKDSTTAKLTEYEKKRNKKISKVRYIVEQYFGLSHLHDGAKRARFTETWKNNFDCWYRQAAFNISRGLKILRIATV